MPRGDINNKGVEKIYQAFLLLSKHPYLRSECATKMCGNSRNNNNDRLIKIVVTGLPDFKPKRG